VLPAVGVLLVLRDLRGGEDNNVAHPIAPYAIGWEEAPPCARRASASLCGLALWVILVNSL
jgi:hypothetical protein